MAIELEGFSKTTTQAGFQAITATRLVHHDKAWLRQVFPGAYERYRDPVHAFANLRRIATDEGMQAYFLRKERRAIGIGSLIFNAKVIHPTIGEVTATDVDYWRLPFSRSTLPHEAIREHRLIVRQLVAENDRLNQTNHQPVMSTIQVDVHKPSIGIKELMEPLGEPTVLTTPSGEDQYGLTKGGAVVQLYGLYVTPVPHEQNP